MSAKADAVTPKRAKEPDDENALYKVPGTLSPPGESDTGIKDKCEM
jgi:hypothetical protein